MGTAGAPGVLSGQYAGNVSVEGVCQVSAGPVLVSGNLTIRPGSSLLANFALNQLTGAANSRLTVRGTVRVQTGATFILGCEPGHFTCADDPNPMAPTLSSRGRVFGNLVGRQALGIVVHNSSIFGSVRQTGGGGGPNCVPSGVFAEMHTPVYSDYEDTNVNGAVTVNALESCWLGFARLQVNGNMRLTGNNLADPDAIEVLANTILGNLSCRENSQVWNSAEVSEETLFPRTPQPNTVSGQRSGQCVLASPETEGGEPGPGPF